MSELEEPVAPKREDLAKFLSDQRSIRAFEKLFELVPSQFNKESQAIQEASTDANIAQTQAMQAISGLIGATRRLKSNEVLLWLSM